MRTMLDGLSQTNSSLMIRLGIPTEIDHSFRRKSISHSDGNRSAIPMESDHRGHGRWNSRVGSLGNDAIRAFRRGVRLE